MDAGPISQFIRHHFRHFNAGVLRAAAESYQRHLAEGGKMMIALAGAMSTAELGISLAAMIRREKIHAISCTGANLEEDIFNLVAHDLYEPVPDYRCLRPVDEQNLFRRQLNRVTDTCIPDLAIRERLEKPILAAWKAAEITGESCFPHEFMFRLLRNGTLKEHYQTGIENSWVHAAMEKNLPIFVPGWEDSTIGNLYAGACFRGEIQRTQTVRGGIEAMLELMNWYQRASKEGALGFFQIGGGIAGDFPICVVPALQQELEPAKVPLWAYFCQISDSTTSYGSYSGAVPNEKITWGKLGVDTPKYVIESDATIVAPLIFAYVLGW